MLSPENRHILFHLLILLIHLASPASAISLSNPPPPPAVPRLLVSLTPIINSPPQTSPSSSPPSSESPKTNRSEEVATPVTVTALIITLTLTFPAPDSSSQTHQRQLNPHRLLSHLVRNGATQTNTTSALQASDKAGPLPLTSFLETDPSSNRVVRYWSATREPIGPITVTFIAEPPNTLGVGNGPRVDLRRDSGGLVGLGEGFLPRPAGDEEEWDVSLRWDLGMRGLGIKAVSSLGEQEEVSIRGRLGRVLDKTYFAVRRGLGRWPPWDCHSGEQEGSQQNGQFAMYWLGQAPPWDMERLGRRVESLTAAVRGFFGEGEDPFAVFWRQAARGYGGAGGFRSFMMEYDKDHLAAEELTADGLENLMVHESVHGYALMNPVRQEDVWYREGVAVYYAVVAPFLAGVVDRGYFLRWMNNNAQAYYTGGTTGLEWKYVVDHYWTSTQLVRTSYFRGFVYLAHVQGLIYRATNGTKGLDDLVLELYGRYKGNYVTQGEHFVELLGGYIGKAVAEASFEEMVSGRLIVPAGAGLARYGLQMVREDAEELELGFSESSLGRGIVTGMVPKSRAEEAGLREGDELVRFWTLSTAADSLDNKMKVVVKRDGKEVDIVFRPRSREKVESYRWVDMEA